MNKRDERRMESKQTGLDIVCGILLVVVLIGVIVFYTIHTTEAVLLIDSLN